jgi:high affinity sulfate transporter 1
MTNSGGTVAKYFPAVSWLRAYPRRWLRGDLIAGLTVWALLLPEGLAYAELAGLPPEFAFFAAPGALLGYALFGTSRQVIVGPTSTIAAMSAAIVASMGPQGTEEFIALTVALAILSGAVFLLAGIARLGFVSQFFSRSVITGFFFGLAVAIAVLQLPKLLGLEVEGGYVLERLWHLVTHLGHTQTWTLFVGLSSLLLLFALERFAHRVPAALVTLVYGIVVVTLFGLEERGVHTVGHIATALPRLTWPDVGAADIVGLLPGALAIALVAIAETVGVGREFASKHHYHIDADQELVALGVSNLASGLSGGFAVGGSLSKSQDNDHAGARTQMSAIFAAAFILLSAVALTRLFHNLPEATLAAIVLFAVWKLMDVEELRRLYTISRVDFAVALSALLGVVLLGILDGLLWAVGISLLAFIYRASQLHFSMLGKVPGERSYGAIERHPGSQPVPGLFIVRPDAPLFFANAARLRDEVRKLVHGTDPPPKALLLDLEGTSELDVPSADELCELMSELGTLEIDVLLARVHSPVRDMMRLTGLLEELGEGRIYLTIDQAVQAFRKEHPD